MLYYSIHYYFAVLLPTIAIIHALMSALLMPPTFPWAELT